MDIACILLASAAAAFALFWRLERSWYLAREAGCFCRRRRGGVVEVNAEGCPVHDPAAWRRRRDALFHTDFGRLLTAKEMAQVAFDTMPDVPAPSAKVKMGRRLHIFWRGRRP